MKDLNHLTISTREWERNSALYARYEVVRQERNCVVLERKPEFRISTQPIPNAATLQPSKENLQ